MTPECRKERVLGGRSGAYSVKPESLWLASCWSNGMYLIQVLLPRAGDKANDARFSQTRAELVEAFDGVTAYLRSPAQGAWIAPDGRVDRDEVVMVEVLVETFDREWWRAYAGTLAVRFEQEKIHIRALRAETP